MTHTSTEQPEALRLAETWQAKAQREASRQNSAYDVFGMGNTPESVDPLGASMAAELRRLHARVQELEVENAHLKDAAWTAIDALEAYQAQRVPLTDEQMRQMLLDAAMAAVPENERDRLTIDEQVLEQVTFFARATERANGITQEKQG